MDDVLKWASIGTAIVLAGSVPGLIAFLKYGLTCQLHEAAKLGQIEKVKKYLNMGHDVRRRDPRFGLTPLHYAVSCRHMEVAKLLMEHGASLDDKSQSGVTVMDHASEQLDAQTRCELEGSSPLHLAAETGNLQRVTELINEGAEVNARDLRGRTPLSYALKEKHDAVVEHLVSHGADLILKDHDSVTPLVIAAGFGSEESVKLLLDHGAAVNEPDNTGSTPMHYAAMMGHVAVAKVLLAGGADLTKKDAEGRTPLQRAVVASPAVAKVLTAALPLPPGTPPTPPKEMSLGVRLAIRLAQLLGLW